LPRRKRAGRQGRQERQGRQREIKPAHGCSMGYQRKAGQKGTDYYPAKELRC